MGTIYRPIGSGVFCLYWYVMLCYIVFLSFSYHVNKPFNYLLTYSAKLLPFDIALQIVEYLDKEEEYIPWNSGGGKLNSIGGRLRDTPIYGAFTVNLHVYPTLYSS
mgnify:CR=1 FL=1